MTTTEQFEKALENELTGDLAREAGQMVANDLAQMILAAQQFERIEFDDDIPVEAQYFSIGHACQLFQILPPQLRALMRAAGIKFAMSTNDCPLLDGRGLLALNRFIREAGKCTPHD